MSVQSSSESSAARPRAAPGLAPRLGTLARLARIGLAIAAIHGLVACGTSNATSESEHVSAETLAPVQGFIARPVQRDERIAAVNRRLRLFQLSLD